MPDLTKACRSLDELKPAARKACDLFLAACKAKQINIFVTETYRSQARQNYLYEQGRTRPGNIVTWTKNSRHTSRLAWDVAVNPPLDLYNYAVLHLAGDVARKLGITWGGNWDTPDRPHFEVTEGWTPPEGEEAEEVEIRYNSIDEVPDWGKATVQALIDKGAFADTAALDLSYDMMRTFVLLGKAGKL
jgi:peptidoglycan L-alanyl-D-glutamate endopeptidase CwlK